MTDQTKRVFVISLLLLGSILFTNTLMGGVIEVKDLKGFVHPPGSYKGRCHEFLTGKKELTLIYKMTGREDSTVTHNLKVISAGEQDGRGKFIAEYIDFKIRGEYSKDHLTWDMVDDGGHEVSFIGECTEYGIAGWMGYTSRGNAPNAYTYQVAIFEKL